MTVKDISGEFIKGYELRDLIGAGGFGAVYRAYQPLIKRDVAMKIILPEYANHPEFIRRFEVEAQLVARLEHLHIVALYDYWRDPQGAYLVMRWLRGGSLRGLLKNGPVEIKTAVQIVDQIASALNAAHRRGVVHRDIKPDNILFDDEQNAYLADFGIAKEVHEAKVDGEDSDDEDGALTGSPFYLSPEQAKSLPVTPQTDLYSLGIVIYEMLTGQPPFKADRGLMSILMHHINDPVPPVREQRPELPPAVESVIQRATAKEPEDRYPDAISLANEFRRALVLTAPELIHDTPLHETSEVDDLLVITRPLAASTLIIVPDEVISNPYKGLQAFQEADANEFFGREELIRRLLNRLAEPVESNRFLAVIGPSGSGKSSVVKAGVIPALRKGALRDSEQWYMAEMVPGADPFRELSAALLAFASASPENLEQRLRTDEGALADLVEEILPPGAECGLVLTVDQFEEVFTLVEDEAARIHFLNLLMYAVTKRDCRFRLLITLRADFYDRPLLYPGFGDLVRTRNEVVLPLSQDEMRAAIIGPAQRVGVAVETGLVAAMIAEIGEQPGALPLLQYALTELFDRRENNIMSLSAYHASGGVRGALARRAEEIYQESDPVTQDAMRQVFLRMVEVGEGQDDTRRRATQVELMELVEESDVVMHLLDQLGKYRLLTFDHDPDTRLPVVSVAHEALIREWQRMRHWLDDSREDLLIQRRIATANHEWRRQKQDASFLASGVRLDQFASLKERGTVALTAEELAYIDASLAQRAAQEEAERRRAEHEALLEKRAKNRLQLLAVVMAVAAVIAGALAVVALISRQEAADQRDKAERSAEVSESLALVANAQKELEKHNNEMAIALALQANTITDPPREAQQMLADAAFSPGAVRVFRGHADAVNTVALSPDGKTALSGAWDNAVILWDVETGAELHRFEGHASGVYSVAFSPDGQWAISGGADSAVILWDVAHRTLAQRFEGHEDTVYSVAFSPDGKTALSASADDTFIWWDVVNHTLLHRFTKEYDGEPDPSLMGINSVAFSPDGTLALVGSTDGSLVLWDLEGESVVRSFDTGPDAFVYSVAFMPDGSAVLASIFDTVHVWDVESGAETMVLRPGSPIYGMAVDRAGRNIALATNDSRVHLFDLRTNSETNYFVGHTNYVTQVAFDPGGYRLISSSGDGTLRLWSLTNGAEIRRYEGHFAKIWSLRVSPDGTRLLTAADDGSARIWDRVTGEPLVVFEEQPGIVFAVFSADGQQVISADQYDYSLMVWDAASGDVIQTLDSLEAPAWCIAASPDGKTVATGLDDGRIILWDLETGEQVGTLEGHANSVMSVNISPDGQQLVSAGNEGIVILWDLASRTELRRLLEGAGAISSVSFSPDGQYVQAASGEFVMIWEIATGKLVQELGRHVGGVIVAAFSRDGQQIVSSAGDGSLHVWDIATGREIRRLNLGSIAWGVAFGPEGKTVFSGAEDATVRQWDALPVSLDALREWVQTNRYVAALSCADQRTYHLDLAAECTE